MQNEKYAQASAALRGEIQVIQKYYIILKNFLAGAEIDNLEIIGTLQVFKDSLERVSSHILTVYVLRGQKIKITWETLLVNLGRALESLKTSAKPDPKSAIQIAFNMSEPKVSEVMDYLEKLKESL
jgi:hypothetical protein